METDHTSGFILSGHSDPEGGSPGAGTLPNHDTQVPKKPF